jgi:hypothetical protein
MTDADQKDFDEMGALALRMMRHGLETGGAVPVIVLREADGKMTQLPFPKELAPLMNSGAAKDLIFGAVRKVVGRNGVTAVLFATDGWLGIATEAGLALPPEELLRLGRESKFETAVELGFVKRVEAIMITIQTAEWVRHLRQIYEREGELIRYVGEPECFDVPQENFAGRQKMFGDLKAENLR